ncbi:MAG: peptide/nickel transport system permease protein [Thermomicrobiales bacterium]|jgi:peptide/nickel transport system permease protein|nr:peptide/nickel transport system permease protein [Thermomicrobiales bacterium]
MTVYLLRRLALVVPTLLGISLVVFLMLHTAGGDPAELKLGLRADEASLRRLRHEMGLDRPLAVQYLDFLSHALVGDFGRSYRSNAPVADEVFSRFPATIELAIVSIVIGAAVGLAAGIAAGTRRHTLFDYTSTFGALLGVSIPTFWLGLALIIVFGIWLRWLPISGRVDPRLGADPSAHFLILSSLVHGDWVIFKDAAKHIILPALTLAGWPAAIIARMTRASLGEALDQDYIRTARAKGLGEGLVVRRHALRNALIPVLTVVGLELGGLLGGAVVTETVFSWPGVGKLTADAIAARDYQVTQGVVLLLGAVFVGLNLLFDLVYAAVDPRIRYAQ